MSDQAPSPPPRLVMMVANGVVGDSRVQKIAWAMAERGWETILLGRAEGARREEFTLGQARVILVPVPPTVSGFDRARRRPARELAPQRAAYLRARDRIAAWDAADRHGRRTVLPPGAGARARRWGARLGTGPVGGGLWTAGSAAAALVDRHGGWRTLNPWFRDLELAFSPVAASLEPDLLHAHDFHMVGLAARLADRLSSRHGRRVPWVYDAHEYLAGIDVPARGDVPGRLRRRMLLGVEREYVGRADAVVTVAPELARRLRADHRLRALPEVVANAPLVRSRDGAAAAPVQDARRAAGLLDGVPVLLYSGGLAPRRGLRTVVGALPELPGVFLVLVARPGDGDLAVLRELAGSLGVADRLRVVPYVAPDLVVPYVAAATAGVVPILHRPNHEISLITKYLEYLRAGLPVLSSDVREMARVTREHGLGEVFRAGDVASFVAAARRLLADPARYRRAVSDATKRAVVGVDFTREADRLHALYARLLGREPAMTSRQQPSELRICAVD